jgi:hypothetical protein
MFGRATLENELQAGDIGAKPRPILASPPNLHERRDCYGGPRDGDAATQQRGALERLFRDEAHARVAYVSDPAVQGRRTALP